MNKVGLFGGTFNPIHNGHINSILTVKEKLHLDQVKVIPASQNPLRVEIHGPTAKQRFELAKTAIETQIGSGDFVEVDDVEVSRGGISYTIDTIKFFAEKDKDSDLHLIVGLDQFENFDKWHEYTEILSLAHLVVTSRPGGVLPETIEEFPKGLKEIVESFDGETAELKTGKKIIFIQLNDIDISASEIRKLLRSGESIDQYVPSSVAKYISDESLYESVDKSIDDYLAFTQFCAQFLNEKSGINVTAYDLRHLEQPTEFSVICSGTSTRHTQSLAERLIKLVKNTYGVYPQNIEGIKEARWVVLDYGSLMVHIFYDYVRLEYRLEELWSEGHRIPLKS